MFDEKVIGGAERGRFLGKESFPRIDHTLPGCLNVDSQEVEPMVIFQWKMQARVEFGPCRGCGSLLVAYRVLLGRTEFRDVR